MILDSVVNHVSSESGLDLGLSKDGEGIPSPASGSSPFSESLSLLAGQQQQQIQQQQAQQQQSAANGPLSFSCEQCGQSFGLREELEKHELTHPTPNQVRV